MSARPDVALVPWTERSASPVARARSACLLLPTDAESAILEAQLRRLGYRVTGVWPIPGRLPEPVEILLLPLASEFLPSLTPLLSEHEGLALGYLMGNDTQLLNRLGSLDLHAVISRPARFASLQAQLAVAEAQYAYQRRLQGKVQHLETQLRARRSIEHATRILMVTQGLGADAAYEQLRGRATASRVSVAEAAENLIHRAADW